MRSCNATVFNLWLACYTEKEIGDKVGMTQQNVAKVLLQPNGTYRLVAKPGEFLKDAPEL